MKYEVKDPKKVWPSKLLGKDPKKRVKLTPYEKSKLYPHISVVFLNPEELTEFDNAIAETRKETGLVGLNRSKIVRKLIKKWVNYEVEI